MSGSKLRPAEVLIVGTGVTGLLTALYIQRHHPDWKVSIIEDQFSSTLPVGENLHMSAFRFICDVLDQPMQVTVKQMVNHNCVLKLGTKFTNWNSNLPVYWHLAGGSLINSWGDGLAESWLANNMDDPNPLRYNQEVNGHLIDMVQHHRLPQSIFDSLDFPAMFVDAGTICKFFKSHICNASWINSSVTSVTEDDHQCFVTTQDGITHTADWIFDCTGFKRVLIQHFSKFDTIKTSVVNSALVQHHSHVTDIPVTMNAQAMNHGWLFQIPMQTRIGNGYVFNRDLTSVDQFEKEFDQATTQPINNKNIIRWHPSKAQRPWYKNLIALGPSAAFNEPLLGTSIELTTRSIARACKTIVDNISNKQEFYDQWLELQLYFINNKILGMYAKAPGTDTDFWKHAKQHAQDLDVMAHWNHITEEDGFVTAQQKYGDIIWNKDYWISGRVLSGIKTKVCLRDKQQSMTWAKSMINQPIKTVPTQQLYAKIKTL